MQGFKTIAVLCVAFVCSARAAEEIPLGPSAPAQYEFSYEVNDPVTGDVKDQKEMRNGDAVVGYYRMMDSDGALRTVKYQADDVNGFVADVIREPITGAVPVPAAAPVVRALPVPAAAPVVRALAKPAVVPVPAVAPYAMPAVAPYAAVPYAAARAPYYGSPASAYGYRNPYGYQPYGYSPYSYAGYPYGNQYPISSQYPFSGQLAMRR